MGKVFSYDSPVWKFMGRLIDFTYLTLLWAVTSLPIITIGASTTTVYYITLKMTENQEEYLTQMYFKNFVRFFKESTKVWLLMLAAGCVLVVDLSICIQSQDPAAVMLLAAFTLIAVVYFMTSIYVFALIARINQTVTGYIKAAFYLAVKYFGWTVLALVIPGCILAVGVFGFWPLLLPGIGLSAYLQSLIFRQIFKVQGWVKNNEEVNHG